MADANARNPPYDRNSHRDLIAQAREQAQNIGSAEDTPYIRRDVELLSKNDPPPQQIGSYKIIGVLGQGGMGIVYEAQQRQPDRLVAIKVMRGSFRDVARRKRFDIEVEILGRLQHPGIAAIYEAGTFDTSSGEHPFFAMELVRGEPLVRYSRARQLDIQSNLTLFSELCDAVQHAHNTGVVHRDLKPTNIIVTNEGKPKILDFGIAKATDAAFGDANVSTDEGGILGTLQYMSPEQAAGDPRRIDTRADVYSLGVILYEMLVGRMPYDVANVTSLAAIRVVQEQPPAKPSTFRRQLRGDMETILLKSLSKQPDRRYQTAASLADDVRRFLEDRPIEARPPSAAYQARMLARRNKPIVVGVLATLVATVIGIVGISWYALEAGAQRDMARREAKTLGHALRVLEGVMIGADPFLGSSGSARFQGLVEHDPEAVGALSALAFLHLEQGRPVLAEREFRLAMDLSRGMHDSQSASTLTSLGGLAKANQAHGRLRDVEDQLRTAIAKLKQKQPKTVDEAVGLEAALASNLLSQQRLDESETLLRAVAARLAANMSTHRLPYFDTQLLLVGVFVESGQFQEAELLLRELLTQVWDNLTNPSLALHIQDTIYEARVTIKFVGSRLGLDGAAKAHKVVLEHWERCRGRLPPDNFVRIHAKYTLARSFISLGNGAKAEQCLRECRQVLDSLPPSLERTKHENSVTRLFQLLAERRG